MKKLFFIFILALANINAIAQTPFKTVEYLDINKIKAPTLVHGDMWWSPYDTTVICEFPKGNKTNIISTGAFWASGYDTSGKLYLSAQSFRRKGNDYWPGPLDSTGALDYATSTKWAKIWKVNYSDILTFLSLRPHTISNTPTAILQWPAKGNPYAIGNDSASLTITGDMAPFVDVDHDGVYNPLKGDYPLMKGDQMLWWVFSDNGPTHDNTNGTPLKIEVHALSYGYSRGTLTDNVIYYEYDVYNKSALDYKNMRMALMNQPQIGHDSYSDFIGFDSARRLEIMYSAKESNGDGAPGTYGNKIPAVGVTLIALPGDLATTGLYQPPGSFTYFIGDIFSAASAVGAPAVDTEYNNYMRSKFRDGEHVSDDFAGPGTPCFGLGKGADAKYVFTGSPAPADSQWSECTCGNVPNNTIAVLASDDFTLSAGAMQKMVLALITTNPDTRNGCPNINYDSINIIADTAWSDYYNPLPPTDVKSIASLSADNLKIYPNPAHDQLYITASPTDLNASVLIYDAVGRAVSLTYTKYQNKLTVNVASLPDGVYTIMYRSDKEQKTALFVKQ